MTILGLVTSAPDSTIPRLGGTKGHPIGLHVESRSGDDGHAVNIEPVIPRCLGNERGTSASVVLKISTAPSSGSAISFVAKDTGSRSSVLDKRTVALQEMLAKARLAAADREDEPLTASAERTCIELAETVFAHLRDTSHLQVVAGAKINGGANFVLRNPRNGRRLDWQIDPTGNRVTVATVDENLAVQVGSYVEGSWPLADKLDWISR